MQYKLTDSHKIFLREHKSPIWNLCSYCLFYDSISLDSLELAMNRVIKKNEALRMSIVDGDQVIFSEYQYRQFERFSFPNLESFKIWAHQKSNEPIADYLGMWNAYLIKVDDRVGLFNIGHHIMSDAMNVTNLYDKINDELKNIHSSESSYSKHLVNYSNYLDSKKHYLDKEYWNNIISETMPLAFSNQSAGECETISLTLPSIESISKKYNVTEGSLIYAAVGLFLMRIQQLNQVSIGIPVLGRTTKEEMNALGLYMHILPLIVNNGRMSFIQFTKTVENEVFDLYRHQQCELPTKALFDVSVDFSQLPKKDDYEFDVIYNDYISSAIEFHFLKQNNLQLNIRFLKGLFRYPKDIIKSFVKLFEGILEQPEMNIQTIPIADLPVLNNYRDIPNVSLYSLIDSQNIGKIIEGEKTYSLQELRRCAEKIDFKIHGNKRVIGVLSDRNFNQLAAIYGIIRGGNAYLPISPDYPKDRIDFMLRQCQCDTVLVERKYLNIVPNGIVIEDTINNPVSERLPVAALPRDPLYVIFTSGSTGEPKGVMVANYSIVNRLLWMTKQYFCTETVVMYKTPFTFDVSVWEIFGFAVGGFSLYILPFEDHYQQSKVVSHIIKGNVTDIHFVPTVFSYFLDSIEKDKASIPSLKNIFLSGEKLDSSLVKRSPFEIHNLYGPTECSVDVSFYDCDHNEDDPVPIGSPIDNCQIYILDKNLSPLPVGVIGQICISGVPVGIGYINDSSVTKNKFVSNPYGSGKLYLTGDYGYYRDDGQLIFVGREDEQIKINGQRIELGEIESALNRLVSLSAVIVQDNRLVAFYTGENRNDLREKLTQTLPSFMIPHVFINVKNIPLKPNGKLDKKAFIGTTNCNTSTNPPIDDLERDICNLFSRILNFNEVGRDDDFFNLGGTSLLMMEALSSSLLSGFSASNFIANPTPMGIAEIIRHRNCENDFVTLYKARKPSSALILFPFAGGDGAEYVSLVKEIEKVSPTTSIYFVPWGCNYDKVANHLKEISSPITFYSHCAGAVIAMKLLDRIGQIDEYFIGGNIPPEQIVNIWDTLDDEQIMSILKDAGLTNDYANETMIKKFRDNTYEYFNYLLNKKDKFDQAIQLVIASDDIFTNTLKNKSISIWKKYFSDVEKVYSISTNTHYFQSVNASKLGDILIKK